MKIDGSWVPESDEELELFDKLHQAKVEAYEAGVDPDQIAAAMSFIASASLIDKPEDDKKSLEERIEEEKNMVKNCPTCDEEIQKVFPLGVGGELLVNPCGHTFDWEERHKLQGWVEDPIENNE